MEEKNLLLVGLIVIVLGVIFYSEGYLGTPFNQINPSPDYEYNDEFYCPNIYDGKELDYCEVRGCAFGLPDYAIYQLYAGDVYIGRTYSYWDGYSGYEMCSDDWLKVQPISFAYIRDVHGEGGSGKECDNNPKFIVYYHEKEEQPPECPESDSTCSNIEGNIDCGNYRTSCISDGDNKYYKIRDSAGMEIRIELLNSGTGCSGNDLYIYDGNCNEIDKITSGPLLVWEGTSSSDIIVRVDSDSDNSNCDFTITSFCKEGPSPEPGEKPSITTYNAVNLEETSAKLKGKLTDMGGDSEVDVWFKWREKGIGIWEETTKTTKNSLGYFYIQLSNLDVCDQYEYKALGENFKGTTTDSTKTFQTVCPTTTTVEETTTTVEEETTTTVEDETTTTAPYIECYNASDCIGLMHPAIEGDWECINNLCEWIEKVITTTTETTIVEEECESDYDCPRGYVCEDEECVYHEDNTLILAMIIMVIVVLIALAYFMKNK